MEGHSLEWHNIQRVKVVASTDDGHQLMEIMFYVPTTREYQIRYVHANQYGDVIATPHKELSKAMEAFQR